MDHHHHHAGGHHDRCLRDHHLESHGPAYHDHDGSHHHHGRLIDEYLGCPAAHCLRDYAQALADIFGPADHEHA